MRDDVADVALAIAQWPHRYVNHHLVGTANQRFGFETNHLAGGRPQHQVPHDSLLLGPVSPAFGLPEVLADQVFALHAGRLKSPLVAIDQHTVQGVESDETEHRLDNVAEPFLAGGQLAGRLKALRHIADCTNNPNRLTAIVTDETSARNHPTVGAVPMLQSEVIEESIHGGILAVAVPGFQHAISVIRVNAPEKRLCIIREFVVPISQYFLIAG